MAEEASDPSASGDPGKLLMAGFIKFLLRKVNAANAERAEDRVDLTAAEGELVRKVLSDNSITFASVRRGDFGDFARKAAEEFPFPDEGEHLHVVQ